MILRHACVSDGGAEGEGPVVVAGGGPGGSRVVCLGDTLISVRLRDYDPAGTPSCLLLHSPLQADLQLSLCLPWFDQYLQDRVTRV